MSEAHPEAAAGRRDADTGELAGETLDGRYAVEGKLGEGGMAVVYAGRHLELARPVAIKVIRR
ncbi:MAG TPA: serine/threonine protein kinase, partial [Polyangiaceae bacterium LLY-WYZ-15_(1-7)]|nr:serine/threonine protein kinase [Polyangiaceae bacterium LLY-WYZ-15_(1-7)]